MEFRFRAGDRGPPGSSSSASGGSPPAPLSHPRDDYFGGPAGPFPPPIDWEVARREEIIQMEVKRRLVEEEVRREFQAKGDPAFSRGHHGGPFFAPDHFVPMPMHPAPHAPPPMPFEGFAAWQGFNQFGPRPHAGFGENMPFLCRERRWSPPPRPKPKHKLKLLEIEPSGRPEAHSSKTKVQRMKRKADTIVGPTVPKKIQKITKDWSCALCLVSATCEAGLNEHLEGRKHKAKLAQCGGSKVITDDKDNLQKITGDKSGIDPCDTPLKICILVDGEMHEVVQKKNYLWCDRCKVRCDSNVTMAGHLRSKKHSKKLVKFWKSIEALRTNTKANEGLSSPCESKGFNQFGPRPQSGFGEGMPFLHEERRWSPPPPKPKHKLQLLEIEPSGRSEDLSSETKVPRMKRKEDTIVGPTAPKKVQKLTKDWSCALCQVSVTCEAGLNEHLEGRKHKAKLAQCGASKVISDDKGNSRKITGNKSGIDPCDAATKICILVDGEVHEVVQKNNYLWCDRCKVRCDSNVTMAGHLRSKKHSKLNKVWTSIEAVRANTKLNEGLTSPCESKVNTNDSTEIPVVIKGDIDMAIEVDERQSIENPVEIKKENTSMDSGVERTNTDTEVHENSPVETPVQTNNESMDMTTDVSQLV